MSSLALETLPMMLRVTHACFTSRHAAVRLVCRISGGCEANLLEVNAFALFLTWKCNSVYDSLLVSMCLYLQVAFTLKT